MGALKLKPQKTASLSLVVNTYKSAAGIQLFEVNSRRAKNMPDDLDDIIIAKMLEIDPKGFGLAYSTKDGNYLTGLAARAYTALQVREKTNKNDGYMVEMTQKVGGGQKGWPWCMYEMQACVGIAETLTGIVSKFPYSGSCAAVRKEAKKLGLDIEFRQSAFGDVWIKVYSNGTGHTGNFDSWISAFFTAYLNEGNTTAGSEKPGGPVVREGGGSYRTARDIKKDNWVMCVRPFKLVQGDAKPVPVPMPEQKPDESNIPRYGEISDRVLSAQRALNRYGASLKEDGKYFELTKAAFARFQKQNGLKGTGIPGPKTMALLFGAGSMPTEIAGTPAKPNWGSLLKFCIIDSDRVEEVRKVCGRMRKNQSTYMKIAEILDTKWEYVALVHYRESSALTLDVYLHNGQKLGKKTTIVPKGVFFRADQFIEAAVDAMKNFRGLKDDGQALEMFERFNGLGYRSKKGDRGVVEYSPYVAAGTNHHDETSKYVADGKYSPTAIEKQLGVMALLKGFEAA
ncbi:Peptidoglycan binding-like [uncultured Caudovirales phage]|uniref:Peptidoglycan binding-like n=1 Tax=uncultured Caudovirales phage TaxID=2100421 RepID=A0A6J5MUJ5_9CAUD|nr:Peptidoglycan binding-like [uncultured Caudovirales phage]